MIRYAVTEVAEKFGREVGFTPPHHPELQPVEKLWAAVKNPVAMMPKVTMAELFDLISLHSVEKCTPEVFLDAWNTANEHGTQYLAAADAEDPDTASSSSSLGDLSYSEEDSD